MKAALSREFAWRAAAPGVALALALALTAKLGSKQIEASLTQGHPSPISPVLIGIVLGMLWRHFVGIGPGIERGVQWILSTLLRAGIALVGLRLTLQGLANVGVLAVPIVVSCIATALLVSRLVGRALGLSTPLQLLLGVGSAVCGCTAIVATAPAVKASAAETGTALACIVVMGSLGMLLYPWLGTTLFSADPMPVGIFLGSAIHDTSQVVGASLITAQQFGLPEVVGIASATKLLRNVSIIALVPLLAWSSRGRSPATTENGGVRREDVFPAFVVWFLVFVLVRALGDLFVSTDASLQPLWQQTTAACQTLSEVLMICGMTAVGLNISLPELYKVGARPLCVTLIVAIATACCSLGLTFLLFRVLL